MADLSFQEAPAAVEPNMNGQPSAPQLPTTAKTEIIVSFDPRHPSAKENVKKDHYVDRITANVFRRLRSAGFYPERLGPTLFVAPLPAHYDDMDYDTIVREIQKQVTLKDLPVMLGTRTVGGPITPFVHPGNLKNPQYLASRGS